MVIAAALLFAAVLQLPASPAPPRVDPPAPPLRLATGATLDTVTVGGRFRSIVRVRMPVGARVVFPALPTTDTLQQVDSARVLVDSVGTVTAAYSLVAWIAGGTPSAQLPIEVVLADGSRPTYRVALRLPYVRSVLPADTAGIRPRPAKGLVPMPLIRTWWRLLLLGLALLAALGAACWLFRRLRRGRSPYLDPRAAALARFDDLCGRAPAGAEALAAFYAEVVRTLRTFLAALDDRWGEHLTSRELLSAMPVAEIGSDRLAEFEQLLAEADPVKFARAVADQARARRFCGAARDWVAGFERGEGSE